MPPISIVNETGKNGERIVTAGNKRTVLYAIEGQGKKPTASPCETCEALRQLEHVKMCLHAAMLAIGSKPNDNLPPERKS